MSQRTSNETNDREDGLSSQEGQGAALVSLVEVMRRLLSEDGCPWDRAQTLESLRPYVIEEAHEVVDAIDSGQPELLREELGDLLLQVVFQAELCDRQGWFAINDVVDGICDKLVRRHPHVFEKPGSAASADAALESWETIKRSEKKDRGALAGVPKALPALLRAVRIGEKARAAAFDWSNEVGPREKIDEELREVDEALAAKDAENLEGEVGDLLFAVASFCRHKGIDPEAALRGTLNRFTERFEYIERQAAARGAAIRDLPEEERDALFEQAKHALRS